MALGSSQRLAEMSTRNIYWGKGGWCVGLTLPHADCFEIWKSHPPGTLRVYRKDCLGVRLPAKKNIFLLSISFISTLGLTQPRVQKIAAAGWGVGSIPGGKAVEA